MEDRDAYHRKIKQQTAKCDPLHLAFHASLLHNHRSATEHVQRCQLIDSAQVRSDAAVNFAPDDNLALPLIVRFHRMPMAVSCAPRLHKLRSEPIYSRLFRREFSGQSLPY
jgi:hypothetical protein